MWRSSMLPTRDLKEAWIGMNDAGFAVMNTASYNIKDDRIPAKNG